MKMCSCMCFTKFILVVFNVIFLLVGLLMVAYGLITGVMPAGDNSHFFEIQFGLMHILTRPIFIVIIGSVVTTIAFFGCFGACGKSRRLLTAYITSLVVVLLLEAAFIVYVVFSATVAKEILPKLAMHSMRQFKEDLTLFDNGTVKLPSDSTSLLWTHRQIELSCCGTHSYTDYSNWTHNVTINGETRSAAVPISCCSMTKDIDKNLTNYDNYTFTNLNECLDGNSTYINPNGCFDSIFASILDSLYIAIGFAAGIVAVEVLLIIVAAVICHRNKKYNMKVCDRPTPSPDKWS